MQAQEQSQVTILVFDIIRSNEGRSSKALWLLIRESMKDTPEEMLKEAIRYLLEKTKD